MLPLNLDADGVFVMNNLTGTWVLTVSFNASVKIDAIMTVRGNFWFIDFSVLLLCVVVALLILRSAWGIIRNSLHILMEGTPHTIDAKEVKALLIEIEGVLDVHDLHVWTITSGMDLFTCHIDVAKDTDEQQVLQKALKLVHDHCGIEHATIQIEKAESMHHSLKV